MTSALFEAISNDSLGFKVRVISATPQPQTVMYQAMHQDYSSEWVGSAEEQNKLPTEEKAGEICVKKLLHSKVYHAGVFEHPQIVFSCGYINHGTMQQFRTHRVGCSFDVQSMRYTSQQFIDVIEGNKSVEEVIYLRPVGSYSDRNGKKYDYTESWRNADIVTAYRAVENYVADLNRGMTEEHARGKVPFDYRQHFVVSFNLRSFLHVANLRLKPDAQLEIVGLCELLYQKVKLWVPEIALHYDKHDYKKAFIGY